MSGADKRRPMRVFDGRNNELMTIRKLERDGDDLVITGKIFGAMPMKARLKPAEARAALKMLTPGLVWLLLTLPFRKDAARD